MRRTTTTAALGAALALALAGCGGDESTSDTTAPPPATETATTETIETTDTETVPPATTVESEPAPPSVHTVAIVVEGGRPRGGIARPEVAVGERVRVRVRSDVADEVHVHGYDLSKDVPAGGTATIAFTADVPGRFEIELEGSGVQLAELSVTP
ncbi:MAG TPA: hypothetical protein VH572_08540 [Gaiella sp.]|jgi:hypothetical protein